ncbi:MAG: helix-turn-helix transcriptional regulator [Clostridia bacterium]|nr:helix-turn-helix transcriptional regulator [Clostridia bacterium]
MSELTMGGFIAAKRQEKGLTQLELGEKLGVTDKAVSKWERDISCPDIGSIPRLAEVLGVSVEELMRVDKEASAAAAEKPKKDLGSMLAMPFKAVALATGVAVAVLSVLEKIDAKSAFIMLGIGLALLGITSLGEDK